MMKKILNILMILVFLAMIMVPLVTADFKGGKVSVAENRFLAAMPKFFTEDGSLNTTGLRGGLENWINDNAGGRAKMSELNTRLQYSLFGTSSKPDERIGRDGWHYYYTDDILDDFTGSNLLSEEALAESTGMLIALRDYLAVKGAELQLLLVPDKKTIYPEYYPAGIVNPDGTSRTDQIVTYVNENTDLHLRDVRAALTAAKESGYTVYSPRVDNAHWNRVGGYIGVKETLDAMREYMPAVPTLPELTDCTVTPFETSRMFNDAVKVTEDEYEVDPGFACMVTESPEYMDRFAGIAYGGVPEVYKRHYVNSDSSLPRLLFVGDSYSTLMFFSIQYCFGETVFLHTTDMSALPDVVETFKPDVVLVESVERMLVGAEYPALQATTQRIRLDQTSEAWEMPELPVVVSEAAWQFVDTVDNVWANGLTELYYTPGTNRVFIEGWAIDPIAGTTASSVLVRVGDKVYRPEYGKERSSVSEYYGEPKYLKCGFVMWLPTKEISDAGAIEIFVVSGDGTYLYPGVRYTMNPLQ